MFSFAYRYARKLDVHNQVIRNVIQCSQSCHGIRGVVILLQTEFSLIFLIMGNSNVRTVNSKYAIPVPCFWMAGKLKNVS